MAHSQRFAVIAPHAMRPVVTGLAGGDLPRHHACGLDRHLYATGGSAVKLVDPSPHVQQLCRRFGNEMLGEHCDPLQLLRAATYAARRDAVLYSLSELSFASLSLPRALERLRPQTIALVHGESNRPHTSRWLDGAMCLNDAAAERLAALGVEHVARVRWGPDLEYAGYQHDPPERFTVVSLGRAGRDTETLLRAIRDVKDASAVVNANLVSPPNNIRSLDEVAAPVACPPGFDPSSYARPSAAFGLASVFVIPLLRGFSTPVGLTEVNDALALGRPIVMTRSRGLGIDIAAEGFGLWVSPGDTHGWSAAITMLRDDADMREEMGRRAREFATNEWNYKRFSAEFDAFTRLHRT